MKSLIGRKVFGVALVALFLVSCSSEAGKPSAAGSVDARPLESELSEAGVELRGLGNDDSGAGAPGRGVFDPSKWSEWGLPEAARRSPSSGAYFNDGKQGDVRARGEELLDRDAEHVIIPKEELAKARSKSLGAGGLVSCPEGDKKPLIFPLEHTAARARIHGDIATVDVSQRFANPSAETLEAEYLFPLPQDAAVRDFVMTIGARKIRGIIRERAEAERIYAQARARGYQAALLNQERPNVFSQKVANIAPGGKVEVSIRYFHALPLRDGAYDFVFPMVVGPRFNPPGSTQGIGAVRAGSEGASGQKNEASYLPEGSRSGHDVAVEVILEDAVTIETVACETHAVHQRRDEEGRLVVTLDPSDRIPNKDFVLRYRRADQGLAPRLALQEGEDGGFFSVLVHPPAELSESTHRPIELVFVIDCSGSMKGAPLNQVKDAMLAALSRLDSRDSFEILAFSNDLDAFRPEPVFATSHNVHEARRFVRRIRAGGGTMMLKGMEGALRCSAATTAGPSDGEGAWHGKTRYVCFMTDGFIGNETEILHVLSNHLGPNRIFSFGVGSSPNRYLMERMASIGQGSCSFLGLQDDGSKVMGSFLDRVRKPALADLSLRFPGCEVSEVYPKRLPDLYQGRPIRITGRYRGAPPKSVSLHGWAEGRSLTLETPAASVVSARNGSLDAVWARTKIKALHDASLLNVQARSELAASIKDTALRHGLVSELTSFIAVDASQSSGGPPQRVAPVPLQVPAGVSGATTLKGR